MKHYAEKILVALGLIALAALLYLIKIFLVGPQYSYFLTHLAFLPIHALVIGVIIEGLLNFRERAQRQKKMNVFVGIFFRQMGLDLLLKITPLVENWDDLESIILVDSSWRAARFRRARAEISSFMPRMNADISQMANFFTMLHQKETDIIQMTRNPHLLDFESFYRTLLSLFHLIEESHIRGPVSGWAPATLLHLGSDLAKTLRLMLRLWLHYLEFLKSENPVLFSFRVGLHNVMQPMGLED